VADPTTHAPPVLPVTMQVTVRYFAAARAAAGVPEERLTIPLTARTERSCTVAAVLAAATERHGASLARVLERCSFLLDEIAVHGTGTAVRDGQALDVLPPFAGG
jgi:molybdopterin synthase sulfur carrier subunit